MTCSRAAQTASSLYLYFILCTYTYNFLLCCWYFSLIHLYLFKSRPDSFIFQLILYTLHLHVHLSTFSIIFSPLYTYRACNDLFKSRPDSFIFLLILYTLHLHVHLSTFSIIFSPLYTYRACNDLFKSYPDCFIFVFLLCTLTLHLAY